MSRASTLRALERDLASARIAETDIVRSLSQAATLAALSGFPDEAARLERLVAAQRALLGSSDDEALAGRAPDVTDPRPAPAAPGPPRRGARGG